jgi:hypothetical protein
MIATATRQAASMVALFGVYRRIEIFRLARTADLFWSLHKPLSRLWSSITYSSFARLSRECFTISVQILSRRLDLTSY